MLKPLFSAINPFWTAVEKETVDSKKTSVEEVAKVVQSPTEKTGSDAPKVEVADSNTHTEPPVAKDNSNVTDDDFKEVPEEKTPETPSKADEAPVNPKRNKHPQVVEAKITVETKTKSSKTQ